MFHKVFALVGLNLISFSNGVVFSQIACVVASLQRKEEGINLSEGQISLIASTLVTMNVFGYPLSAVLANKLGRRYAFIILSIMIVCNWIIMYSATEMYQFMLSRIIGGIAAGGLWKLNIFVTAEYTSPETRLFYMNMITTAAPAFGSCLAHALGIVLQWRTVTLISIIPAAFGVVLPYFWVESPHWLASRGKFEECQVAFRKLHGCSAKSERELDILLKMERTKLKSVLESNSKHDMKRMMYAMKKKYFWGLLFMSCVIHLYIAAGGKLVFTSLATVMLEEITGTPDVLLYTLMVDGFIIIGSCISCFTIRNTSMRKLLFTTGIAAHIILLILSPCIYYKNGHNYFNWIIVSLLASYFILVNAGPYPLLEGILSEMFPLELKLYIFSISGVILVGFLSLSLFLLPFIVHSIGYPGLFLLNAATMSVCLGYLWVKWPETKGKTLQEIEVFFKTDNFDVDEVLSREQSSNLII